MIMDSRNFSIALIGLWLCFAVVISELTDCNCPGPLKHYKEIGCTPVFEKPGDCCPKRYNCDQLKNLPSDKCFVNGYTYEIGETLRDEDTDPCDSNCVCLEGFRGAAFSCRAASCEYVPTTPGCYRKHNRKLCCDSGPEICPEKEEDRATCVVDGIIYRDGDYFKPATELEKDCYCGEGYTGQNVEPFCTSPENRPCRTMLYWNHEILQNCVPTYYYDQSPKTDCSLGLRCQNDKDTVIANTSADAKSAAKSVNPDMFCKFGNLTMQIGDELNQSTHFSSICMKCVCEVPPVPTCQRLSEDECDIKKYLDF